MKKYVMEFIGTLFLVLAVGFTGNPIAIGITLAVMVYIGGHISGAHYNPAVTIAVWLRGKIKKSEIPGFVLAQLLAAFTASILIIFVGGNFVPEPAFNVTFWQAILIEILFTFVLAIVILTVTTSNRFKGNYIYGLAIGFALMAGAYVGGPISSGVYNPAVALGPILLSLVLGNSYPITLILLFIIGPFTGGILAAIIFKYLNPKE
jgi:aquaporin Z